MATIKPQFHERQYEFCVNADLVAHVGALIAGYIPGIPSPQQEGVLGWDASVPMPIYGRTFLLQYKTARLTTKLAGGNAKFWKTYGTEYYRFPLHRDRDGDYVQHQLLLEASGDGVEALYCAPYFHETKDLVGALQAGTVVRRSALIPVASLGGVTAGSVHSVSYPVDPATEEPHIHSEAQRGERLSWDEAVRRREQPTLLDEALFHGLSSLTLERARRRREKRPRERSVRAEDSRAAAFLRAAVLVYDELDATLVITPAGQASSGSSP
jgi:hypothetical protein